MGCDRFSKSLNLPGLISSNRPCRLVLAGAGTAHQPVDCSRASSTVPNATPYTTPYDQTQWQYQQAEEQCGQPNSVAGRVMSLMAVWRSSRLCGLQLGPLLPPCLHLRDRFLRHGRHWLAFQCIRLVTALTPPGFHLGDRFLVRHPLLHHQNNV